MNIVNIILSTAKDLNIKINNLDLQTYLGILKLNGNLPGMKMVYWTYGLKEKEIYQHFSFYSGFYIDINFELESRGKYYYVKERKPLISFLLSHYGKEKKNIDYLYSYVHRNSGWLNYKEEILQGEEIEYNN